MKIQTLILSFVAGFVVGLILTHILMQLYFVGILLSFIVIYGQNRQAYLNMHRHTKKSSSFYLFILAFFGYLLAGIIQIYC